MLVEFIDTWQMTEPGRLARTRVPMPELAPGEVVTVSGQYRVIDDMGQMAEGTSEYTLVAGEPAPAAPGKGLRFELVDETKHIGGEK